MNPRVGTQLEKVLLAGQFALTLEIGPPQSPNPEPLRKKAALLKGLGDGYNVTDNQTAVVRMSSIAASKIILDMGLEPVMQMVCRDRNRIAMQSDILGAAALGVGNLLCLTGDHQSFGDHPQAKGVFDLDSTQLIQVVKMLRDDKKFLSGEKMNGEVKMYIGAAENPFGDPFEFRVMRLARKVKAGVDFIQTQAIFDVPMFARWMKMVVDQGLDKQVHILAGVIPMKSAGMAKHMAHNVPGIILPEQFVTRMEQAKDPKEEGVKICLEMMAQIKEIPGVHGIHIMAVGWEDMVPSIVEKAGLMPRPQV